MGNLGAMGTCPSPLGSISFIFIAPPSLELGAPHLENLGSSTRRGLFIKIKMQKALRKHWRGCLIFNTRMHSSRMRTFRCSGRLSCHAHPPPSTTHALPPCMSPTMHAPLPRMPSPVPCMPPAMPTPPCGQNSWHTLPKALPFRNFVCRRQKHSSTTGAPLWNIFTCHMSPQLPVFNNRAPKFSSH